MYTGVEIKMAEDDSNLGKEITDSVSVIKQKEIDENSEKEILNELKQWKQDIDVDVEELYANIENSKPISGPSYTSLNVIGAKPGYGISKIRKSPEQLYILYLTNQFIYRGVNIRGNKVVSRGYKIEGGDKKGYELCSELIRNSGGISFIKQLSINADVAGRTFVEILPNDAGTKFMKLKHINPISISFIKDSKTGLIKVDSNGKPIGYLHYYVDENGNVKEKEIIMSKRILMFKFDSIGDEFEGVSLLQPAYDTIIRLMNMEYSAALAAIKTANPLLVGTCNSKSPNIIRQWGSILGKISGKDQVFIPEGMSLSMLSPGQQNFSEYSTYFLNAVVSATGVPKSILLGESSNGNRAETITLSREFNEMIRINQIIIEDFINEIFIKFGLYSNFKPPVFVLNDITEDTAMTAELVINLVDKGIISISEARKLLNIKDIGLSDTSLDKKIKKSDMKTYFPSEEGSPEGSQKGVKKNQKTSKDSIVNPITTK